MVFLIICFSLVLAPFISPIIGLWALWEKNALELAIWSPFYRHWLNNRPIIIHVKVVNDIFNTENWTGQEIFVLKPLCVLRIFLLQKTGQCKYFFVLNILYVAEKRFLCSKVLINWDIPHDWCQNPDF